MSSTRSYLKNLPLIFLNSNYKEITRKRSEIPEIFTKRRDNFIWFRKVKKPPYYSKIAKNSLQWSCKKTDETFELFTSHLEWDGYFPGAPNFIDDNLLSFNLD